LTGKTTLTGTINYSYDYEDRLTQITYPNTTTSSMTYDGDDRRVSATNTIGVVTKFVFDGGNVIQETDGNNSLIADYTVEPQELMGNIISRKDTTGTNSFYHYSALSNISGNVTALTDTNQTTIATYNYEAFGNIISQTGTATNNYKFSTKNLDDDSNLYYFGARYYDPEIGRFITKDPDGGDVKNPLSLNPYIYANDNPVNMVDPDGRKTSQDKRLWKRVLKMGNRKVTIEIRTKKIPGNLWDRFSNIGIPAAQIGSTGIFEFGFGMGLLATPEPSGATKFAGGSLIAIGTVKIIGANYTIASSMLGYWVYPKVKIE
ncbi:MAG: RHS repeat-associated core domain-containing protein, partial [Actinobacteria bacterium]|nr:RHS repeat-associated core domain-containing protein [Actinomycetota bacterium]